MPQRGTGSGHGRGHHRPPPSRAHVHGGGLMASPLSDTNNGVDLEASLELQHAPTSVYDQELAERTLVIPSIPPASSGPPDPYRDVRPVG